MNRPTSATLDFWDSLRHPHLWVWTGLQDIKLRYRRSMLGPWWLTISTGVLIASMGFLYAGIFRNSISDYLPHFAVGQIFWLFFAGQINESATGFIQFESILKQATIPLSSYILRVLVRNLIIFSHNAVILIIIFVIFGFNFSMANFLIIPGCLILVATMLALSMSIAILCTRFRDMAQIVASGLQILFFLSPIFWKASMLHGVTRSLLIKLNPVYYLIEIVRQPLFGSSGNAMIWVGAVTIMTASIIIGIQLFSVYRNRILYWL